MLYSELSGSALCVDEGSAQPEMRNDKGQEKPRSRKMKEKKDL